MSLGVRSALQVAVGVVEGEERERGVVAYL